MATIYLIIGLALLVVVQLSLLGMRRKEIEYWYRHNQCAINRKLIAENKLADVLESDRKFRQSLGWFANLPDFTRKTLLHPSRRFSELTESEQRYVDKGVREFRLKLKEKLRDVDALLHSYDQPGEAPWDRRSPYVELEGPMYQLIQAVMLRSGFGEDTEGDVDAPLIAHLLHEFHTKVLTAVEPPQPPQKKKK